MPHLSNNINIVLDALLVGTKPKGIEALNNQWRTIGVALLSRNTPDLIEKVGRIETIHRELAEGFLTDMVQITKSGLLPKSKETLEIQMEQLRRICERLGFSYMGDNPNVRYLRLCLYGRGLVLACNNFEESTLPFYAPHADDTDKSFLLYVQEVCNHPKPVPPMYVLGIVPFYTTGGTGETIAP